MTVLNSGMSRSYSTQRVQDLPRLSGFDFSGQFIDNGITKSLATIGKQVNLRHNRYYALLLHSLSSTSLIYVAILKGAIAQLLEHISTLNDRIDNVTSKLEELNAKFSIQRDLSSSQKAKACNGSAPTSYLVPGLGNVSRSGSTVLSSASSLQGKESPIVEEVR